MLDFNKKYSYPTNPEANEKAIVKGDKYRFTVLTDRLIRIELSDNGEFEDRATQFAINRNLSVPMFTVEECSDSITITTERIRFTYFKDGKPDYDAFCCEHYVDRPGTLSAWRNRNTSSRYNLKGTIRTLDFKNGEVELENGLISKDGFSVIDDSLSPIINANGLIEHRNAGSFDIYLFAFYQDFYGALDAYYKVSGAAPLLPRYALGNMWCKNADYSQQEYMELMERFATEKIPFSVAIIDMNWHTYLNNNLFDGWTGYTWNKERYPDYKKFLKDLKDRKLEVSINLHPKDGVRPHEEMYPQMAKAMGIKEGETVAFDLTDPKFIENYFRIIHNPYEDDGVTFYWIDWQQGTRFGLKDIDPLFLLNHYHTVDMQNKERRPMIMSRYAGWGGHRYPIGFSGDVRMSWESLKFQPYFNICATNAGFTWWSNDIGGFNEGIRDDELFARWAQLGVFSPINRLHSDGNPVLGKEPWNYSEETKKSVIKALRLRYALIPYIYSMNYLNYKNAIPLITPMYYKEPNERGAAFLPKFRNQYYFGSEMIVAPITEHTDEITLMGKTDVYLPEGIWFDFSSGAIYNGGQTVCYRNLQDMPVFVKAGGIIPLNDDECSNATENPQTLRVRVFAGSDNKFSMYEDDGISNGYKNGKFVITEFVLKHSKKPEFTISFNGITDGIIPCDRNYIIEFNGYKLSDNFIVTEDGKERAFDIFYEGNKQLIRLRDVKGDIKISFIDDVALCDANKKDMLLNIVMRSQGSNVIRAGLYDILNKGATRLEVLEFAHKHKVDDNLLDALLELL